MDQPRSQTSPGNADITLTPDMRPGAANAKKAPVPRPARRGPGNLGALLLGSAGLVLGLAALGGTAWLHTQTQREILRLSTEMAQLRVSLDLYARNAARPEAAATPAEQPVLPPIAAPGAEVETPVATETPVTANADDCLPSGMRLLVASGDNYPICGQSIAVDVATVDNGYVMLTDGTTIPSGGTVPLLGSACMIGVTSSGDEGLTGYAEIRVTC